MKSILEKEYYYTVHSWMINKLKLSGSELNLYAIIYAFSQKEGGEFSASHKFVMEVLGIKSNKTVCSAFKSLIKKGYIKEVSHNRSNGGNTNVYRPLSKEEILKKLEEREKGACDSPVSSSENFKSEKVERGEIFVEKCRNGGVESTHEECKNYTLSSVKITPEKSKNYTCGSVKITPPYNKEEINYLNKREIKIEKEEGKKENKYIGENGNLQKGEGRAYAREKYVEIMDRYSLSEKTKEVLFKFISHCNLNGRMLTNDKLERIIIFLEGKNEEEKEKLLLKAIDKGCFDILKEERKSKRYGEKSSSTHFENERKYTQEYFDSLVTNISDIKI